MWSYHYRNPDRKDSTVSQPFHLYDGNLITCKDDLNSETIPKLFVYCSVLWKNFKTIGQLQWCCGEWDFVEILIWEKFWKYMIYSIAAPPLVLNLPTQINGCLGGKVRQDHIHGLVQERRKSNANALESHLSCTNPSTWWMEQDKQCVSIWGACVNHIMATSGINSI